MMPNTSVNPAASRNNSSPNCNPFKICSTTSSMVPTDSKSGSVVALPLLFLFGATVTEKQNPCSLHRTFVVEAVLIVLDDGRDRLQRQFAVGALDHVLKVEALDRDMVVAEL